MAHTCPDCGQACYCNGDIDDILLETEEDQEACTHCSEEPLEDEWPDEW